jgi:DNA polymerase III epsilon subunit family exonuclease
MNGENRNGENRNGENRDTENWSNNWQSAIPDLGTPLHEATFVVLDLETSGGAPHLGAGITEIGAVKVSGGVHLDTFSTLVNPGHPIPSYITALTGIDDALVYDAPSIEFVLPDLFQFLGDDETVFVAQNAPFDLSFLKAAARLHGHPWPQFRILDTAILARRVLTREEAPNCKLGTLAQVFGAEVTPNHRALDDAKATVDVLHGIFERLAGFDVFTVEETLDFSALKKYRSTKPPTSAREQ